MFDLKDLQKDLKAGLEQVEDGKAKMLDAVGEGMAKVVKQHTPVDSGDLKDSIEHKVTNKDTVEVVSPLEYAPYVDNGHMSGSRFVKGAHMFDKGMLKADEIMSKEINKFLSKLRILR